MARLAPDHTQVRVPVAPAVANVSSATAPPRPVPEVCCLTSVMLAGIVQVPVDALTVAPETSRAPSVAVVIPVTASGVPAAVLIAAATSTGLVGSTPPYAWQMQVCRSVTPLVDPT